MTEIKCLSSANCDHALKWPYSGGDNGGNKNKKQRVCAQDLQPARDPAAACGLDESGENRLTPNFI